MYNLLKDSLIRVCLPGKSRKTMTLPEVLAQLSGGDIESFVALQLHQSHAWHAFLVQLAAIAITRGNDNFDKSQAHEWAYRLSALTQEVGGEEAWHLINENLSEPAFMQPVIPEGCLDSFKCDIETPDQLDILATSKNHDIKRQRIVGQEADHWIYALITLQTMQGFFGIGNYGIYRMNGGFGSRPCIAYTPSHQIGMRFRRDVEVLCKARDQLAEDYGYHSNNGLHLLWLHTWDGKRGLSLDQLDPFFIEICRRIRLRKSEETICAYFKASGGPLIGTKAFGNTGDPWTPVKKSGKGLTVSSKGFSYEVVFDLLFSGEYQPGICQKLQSNDPNELLCIMQALVRGQGITEGFYERHLPIPGKARTLLFNSEARLKFSDFVKRRLDDTARFSKDVLRRSILRFFQAEPKSNHSDIAAHCVKNFEAAIDLVFFPFLWKHLESDPDVAKAEWLQLLDEKAWSVLQEIVSQMLVSSVRYYKAVALAEKTFKIESAKLRGSDHAR
ncbi:hypothetical protein PNK_1124 [Candidatus Protochlamydia naegleriophila]|uniref:Type I-E CRISPR-associated protein Cse1/CasA n=1 Tax=Candidatus Protochlamydia naegleriophila TaxID=389348 RepID=A0A0U5JFR6_9BACT|nr:hypothetical protein [Candidatus Protochlamydia naegleriophila]CUI16741.1 hypothetical protein PNK_1124 [Candidatus Protochlamydia naegleriophila]